MPLRDTLLALLVIVIWGFNVIVIKVGVSDMPPLLLTALRFAVVAALVVPFTRVTRRQVPWLLLLSITFGTLHFALLFVGLRMVEAGTGAILVQLGTPFATILAAVFLKDRLGAWRITGLATAFLGAAVLAGGPTVPDLMPAAFLLTCAFAWASSNLIIKVAPPIAPLTLAGWTALFGLPQVVLWSALFEDGQWQAIQDATWRGWGAVLYTALMSSILAYGLWYWLLRKHQVNHLVPLTLLNPVLAVAFGVWLLGDSLGPHKLIGGALTIGGVAVIIWRQSSKGRPLDPRPQT